jgi:hypothetical protein
VGVGGWPGVTVGACVGLAGAFAGDTIGDVVGVVGDVEVGEVGEVGGVTVKGCLARTPEVADPMAGS